MGTTYVYLATNVDDSVSLTLARLGPEDLNSAVLTASTVGKNESKKLIMTVSRGLNFGMYLVDTSLAIASTYIASLES